MAWEYIKMRNFQSFSEACILTNINPSTDVDLLKALRSVRVVCHPPGITPEVEAPTNTCLALRWYLKLLPAVCANHNVFDCSIFVFLILELSIQRANRFFRFPHLIQVTISHKNRARTSGRCAMNYWIHILCIWKKNIAWNPQILTALICGGTRSVLWAALD